MNSNENGNGNGYIGAQAFLDAIPGSGGIISVIARRVGCTWHTAKKYVTEYATVKQAHEDECNAVLDMAEGKVIDAMHDGDGVMIRYYLSTKGKHRGFTERHEVTGAEGGPIVVVNWEDGDDTA